MAQERTMNVLSSLLQTSNRIINMGKEYFVFISYSSLDDVWAIWLKHELDHYHLPASFNGRTDVRDNLRNVFRIVFQKQSYDTIFFDKNIA